ncbi:MAG: ketopantoate reductase C-terminal domain-containing protein [Ferrimonas sp.]
MAQLYGWLLWQQRFPVRLLRRHTIQPQWQRHQLFDQQGAMHEFSLYHQANHQITDFSAVLLFTKAQEALAAAHRVLCWLPQSVPLVLLHNGMGPQQQLAQAYPQHNIWAGSVSDGAERLAPYQTIQRGQGARWVGPLTAPAQNSSLPAALTQLNFIKTSQVQWRLWQKLTVNGIINPLCCRDKQRNGALLTAAYQTEIAQLAQEWSQIGQALQWPDSAKAIRQRVLTVARNTAENRCSSLQDRLAKRPTELPYICGYGLQKGQQHGLLLPHLTALYRGLMASSCGATPA